MPSRPIEEDSRISFPNCLVLGSHRGHAGNSTSMFSGSRDGEAKSEVTWRSRCSAGACTAGKGSGNESG